MRHDVDLAELHAALEARRAELGLSWTQVAVLLGMSPSTLRGFRSARTAEADGVLRAQAWVEGDAAAPRLRVNVRALYDALDAQRAARALTWTAVAKACAVGQAASLTRLRDGGRVAFPDLAHILRWLGAPVTQFVRER